MADIKNVKIGENDPLKIMFDDYYHPSSYYKFDFTEWEINTKAGHEVEVTYNKVIIKKFKPNVWIMHTPRSKSGRNVTDMCNLYRGTKISAFNLQSILPLTYHLVWNAEAERYDKVKHEHPMINIIGGNPWTRPRFVGFLPAAMTNETYPKFLYEVTYIWESNYNTEGLKVLPAFSDNTVYRMWDNGNGTYGTGEDIVNRLMFEENIADTYNHCYAGMYGFGLFTSDIENFDDERWQVNNGSGLQTITTKQVILTKRIESTSNFDNIYRNGYFYTYKLKVTGLLEGDRLEYGAHNAVILESASSIKTDGIYTMGNMSGYNGIAYKLYGDPNNTSPVTLEIINEDYPDGIVDISDSPIVLTIPLTEGCDPTSVECWDLYTTDSSANETHTYHKDKTLENCWKEYGLLIPNEYNYLKDNFWESKYVIWLEYNKVRVYNNAANLVKATLHAATEPYITGVSLGSLKIKVLSLHTNIKAVRKVINVTEPVYLEYPLSNDYTIIPSYYKNGFDRDTSLSEGIKVYDLTFEGLLALGEYVDLEIMYEWTDFNTLIKRLSSSVWNPYIYRMIWPETIDFDSNDIDPPPMTTIKWLIQPINTSIWNRVKAWFANNIIPSSLLCSGSVFASSTLDSITLKLPPDGYLWGEANFVDSNISSIHFILTKDENGHYSHISSPQRFFQSARSLRTFTIDWADENTDHHYLCGATSVVDGMSNLWNLENGTYPNWLINWNKVGYSFSTYSEAHTLLNWVFYQSTSLVTIPRYNDSDLEECMLPATAQRMFTGCYNLVTIGPVVDLRLIDPINDTSYAPFYGCTKLQNVRVRNLNHGTWKFDLKSGGTEVCALWSNESIKYLFDNLKDLTTYRPSAHHILISNSFRKWTLAFPDPPTTYQWNYYLTRADLILLRQRTVYTDTPTLELAFVLTNQKFESGGLMIVQVLNLRSEDRLILYNFTTDTILHTFTNWVEYSYSKNNTDRYGFLLQSTDTSLRNQVTINITNGHDDANPKVDHADLYCPAAWTYEATTGKITQDMVQAANTKGWLIYVGGTKIVI